MESLDPQVSPYLAHPDIAPSLHMHVGTEETKIKFDVEKKYEGNDPCIAGTAKKQE